MLIQTISLVLSGRQDIAPSLIAWFAAIAILFWLLSWPTKAPLKNRSTIAPEEQGDRVKAAGATGLQ